MPAKNGPQPPARRTPNQPNVNANVTLQIKAPFTPNGARGGILTQGFMPQVSEKREPYWAAI